MRTSFSTIAVLISMAALLLPSPAILAAQSHEASAKTQQAQPAAVVREGELAVKLAAALRLADTDSEDEAMRELELFCVAPAHGWVAGRPVTPQILRQLRQSVYAAGEESKFEMKTDDALRRFDEVVDKAGLTMAASAGDGQLDLAGNEPVPPPAYPPDYYRNPWYPYAFAWGLFLIPELVFMYDYHHHGHHGHWRHR